MVGDLRPAAAGLLERGGELSRIEQVIEALGRGHGGVLVIEGAAGIGKSTLLRALREAAAEQELQTLAARGSELERDLGFGVVRQLLEGRLVHAGESERAELLAGAARLMGGFWPRRPARRCRPNLPPWPAPSPTNWTGPKH